MNRRPCSPLLSSSSTPPLSTHTHTHTRIKNTPRARTPPPPPPKNKGGRDTLAVPEDVARLKAALAAGVLVHHTHEPDYAHLDYELGSDAQRSYDTMIELALRYTAGGGA